MKQLIKKFVNLFKKQKKEVNFIDTPMKITTIQPDRRGFFSEETNYYQRMKNY
jgi:hypothetical protein